MPPWRITRTAAVRRGSRRQNAAYVGPRLALDHRVLGARQGSHGMHEKLAPVSPALSAQQVQRRVHRRDPDPSGRLARTRPGTVGTRRGTPPGRHPGRVVSRRARPGRGGPRHGSGCERTTRTPSCRQRHRGAQTARSFAPATPSHSLSTAAAPNVTPRQRPRGTAAVRSGRRRAGPDYRGFLRERLKGLEPSTFCMASRRSSQLSYSREVAEYNRPPPPRTRPGASGRGPGPGARQDGNRV